MAFLAHAAAAADKYLKSDPLLREAAAGFLAVQSCMSYAIAGAAKLSSPVWRDGTAVPAIFRTHTYGHPWLYEFVCRYPSVAKALAWTVIAAEISFPLVLVAPRPIARGILLTGVGFHVGNAHFMGLNRFLWSFSGTYPAIVYTARHLGRQESALTRAAANGVRRCFTAAVKATRISLKVAPMPMLAAVGVAGAAVAAGTVIKSLMRDRTDILAAAPGRVLPGSSLHVRHRRTANGPTIVFENGLGLALNPMGVDYRIPSRGSVLPYLRSSGRWLEPTGSHRFGRRVLDAPVEPLEVLSICPHLISWSGTRLVGCFCVASLAAIRSMSPV